MRRALVLNAGASWAAYQVGALRHLVRDRHLQFSMCAGTGVGAMNAALVACGAFDALDQFWSRIGWRTLLRANFRTPWAEAPFVARPQREFLAKHVSESHLAQRGVRLAFSYLDLQTGLSEILQYPGATVPLIDALMGAVALPGCTPPSLIDGHQSVEGTMVRGFILTDLLDEPFDEIYAVAAAPIRPGAPAKRKRYGHWRAMLSRAIEMNQAFDTYHEIEIARGRLAARAARAHVARAVPEALASRIADPVLAARVRDAVMRMYDGTGASRVHLPSLIAITPSAELGYPMWSFRGRHLDRAIALGEADARRALAGAPQ